MRPEVPKSTGILLGTAEVGLFTDWTTVPSSNQQQQRTAKQTDVKIQHTICDIPTFSCTASNGCVKVCGMLRATTEVYFSTAFIRAISAWGWADWIRSQASLHRKSSTRPTLLAICWKNTTVMPATYKENSPKFSYAEVLIMYETHIKTSNTSTITTTFNFCLESQFSINLYQKSKKITEVHFYQQEIF